jgi:hypothetical protein
MFLAWSAMHGTISGSSGADSTPAATRPSREAVPRLAGLHVAFLGGVALPEGTEALASRIGSLLAAHAHVTVATSGYTGQRGRREGSFTWLIAGAFALALPPTDVERRLATYIVLRADGTLPRGYASLGTRIVARGRHHLQRQAQIVARSDILCTGGGSTGTVEFVRLAMLIERPVLPLPFFGGASRDLWFQHRDEVQADFGLSDDRVARWSQLDAARLSTAKRDALAEDVVMALLDSRRGNCLVCMPFADRFLPLYERLIRPAIEAAHLYPLRLDQESTAGDIGEALRDEIRSARCLVAVLDERNPNVLYEVGFAHALGKPVVLLQGEGDAGTQDPALPFDIRTHRVLTTPRALAGAPLQSALEMLQATLRANSGNG